MRTIKLERSKRGTWPPLRLHPRRPRTAHDRWLIFNMQLFNCEGGWNQLLTRQQTHQLGK